MTELCHGSSNIFTVPISAYSVLRYRTETTNFCYLLVPIPSFSLETHLHFCSHGFYEEKSLQNGLLLKPIPVKRPICFWKAIAGSDFQNGESVLRKFTTYPIIVIIMF